MPATPPNPEVSRKLCRNDFGQRLLGHPSDHPSAKIKKAPAEIINTIKNILLSSFELTKTRSSLKQLLRPLPTQTPH